MAQNLCKIRIMGHEYSIRSESPPDEVERVAGLVDERMKDIARSTQTIDSMRTAILAAITLADDLSRTKKLLDEVRQEHLNRDMKLIHFIDQALNQSKEVAQEENSR